MSSQSREDARGAMRLPAFSDGSRVRLFLGATLYLAQGLPQGVLFFATPAWLTANGQPAAVVGSAIAASTLPWTLKYVIGAAVDRFTFLPMGRRRIWLVGAQFCIVVLLFAAALSGLSERNLPLLLGFLFALSALTAVQDVALDALVIDLTPEDERGNMNGYMLGGKIVGLAGGGALAGHVAEVYSFDLALAVVGALFVVPALVGVAIRERAGERLLPWTRGGAAAENRTVAPPRWLSILATTLRTMVRRDPLVVVVIAFSYGVHQAISEATMPMIGVHLLGWGEGRYTSVLGLANLALAPFAVLVGGRIIDRLGPKRVALGGGLLAACVYAGFAALDRSAISDVSFIAFVLCVSAPSTLLYLAMLVLMMRVSDPRVAATSFTLLTAANAVGLTAGGALTGAIDAYGAYQALLVALALFVAVSGISALAVGLRAKPSERQSTPASS